MVLRCAIAIAVVALGATACGGCEDGHGAFFDPEPFGTYLFEPAPDIETPRVIDFGEVEPGAAVWRETEIANVGRLALVVDAIDVSDPAFTPWSSVLFDDPTIEPRTARSLTVTFTATHRHPVREQLSIVSNDPDEPVVPVALLANRQAACVGSFAPGKPVWQMHDGEGPMCWPTISGGHGHVAEYDYASIPRVDDPDWLAEPDDRISFERRSTLCGTDCACRGGGDFTYFQTMLYLPAGARVGRYLVEIHDVDDGARVTVFNSRNPEGITDADSYARIPGGSSADLAPYLITGENRIVITHVDDCCSVSRIRDVIVTVDGEQIDGCAND